MLSGFEILLILILMIFIVVLVLVLMYETFEYRKTRRYRQELELAIVTYSNGYAALARSIQAMEQGFESAAQEHSNIADEVNRQGALLEIHNRALMLSPVLVEKREEKIP